MGYACIYGKRDSGAGETVSAEHIMVINRVTVRASRINHEERLRGAKAPGENTEQDEGNRVLSPYACYVYERVYVYDHNSIPH